MLRGEITMRAHVTAVFKSFPFLERYYRQNDFSDARVERVDSTLAECKAEHYGDSEGYLGTRSDFRLFDANGRFILRVGFLSKWRRWVPFLAELTRESVWDALRRSRCPVHYIVAAHGGVLVVFKPPKDVTIHEWIIKQIGEASTSVKETIAAIDAEA